MTPREYLLDGIAFGCGGFACYVIAVLAGMRLLRRVEPAVLVVALAVFCSPSGALFGWFGHRPFNVWAMLACYSFLTLSFLMVFGAVYKSLSLRILLSLMSRPSRTDSCRRLFEAYLVDDSFRNRLDVAMSSGLVAEEAGYLRLTDRGEKLARRVKAIQASFGIFRSG